MNISTKLDTALPTQTHLPLFLISAIVCSNKKLRQIPTKLFNDRTASNGNSWGLEEDKMLPCTTV
jgi:hypothetical protein